MTEDTAPGSEERELAELRGRLRGRWKAERRTHEREALHEHWAQRNLIDAVRETMDRGDEIAIHLPGPRVLVGHIAGLGRDYVVLRSSEQSEREYAVRLAASTDDAAANPYAGPVLYVAIRGGNRSDKSPPPERSVPPTFQAVLQQSDFHQQADPHRLVELSTSFHPHGLQCTIRSHAGDHLYIRDEHGHDILMPVGAINYISWAHEPV